MAISLLTFLYNNIIMAQARGNSNKSIYQPIHPREASMTFQGVKENRESRAIPYGRHLEPFLSFFSNFSVFKDTCIHPASCKGKK